jgi:prepilin-type processing-associated H-X9-DG protein
MSIAQVADGTSKTIMLSENMHAWYWSFGAQLSGQSYIQVDDPATNKIRDAKHLFGFVWKNLYPTASQPSAIERINGDRYFDQLNPGPPTSMLDAAQTKDFANVSSYEPYGFPNSAHSGGVNIAFCDGHLVFIAEAIDPVIYGQLMTSNRNRSRLINYSTTPDPTPERKMTPPPDSAY